MSDKTEKKTTKTKIRCVISGLTLSVRPDVYDQRIAKFGSEEALLAGYVSNASKKMLREGLSVTEIRTKAGTVNVKSLPSVSELEDVIKRVTEKKAKKASGSKKAKASAKQDTPANEAIDEDVKAFLGTAEAAPAPVAVAKKKK